MHGHIPPKQPRTQVGTHCCRHCRSTLAAPVENPHKAFCGNGCHTAFYRHRCRVCERPIDRKTERRQLCGRRKCRNEFQRHRLHFSGFGYPSAKLKPNALENSIKLGLKSDNSAGRGWRIVAGPPGQAPGAGTFLHCAVIGGEEAVAKANELNRRYWRGANANAEERCLIKPHTPPVNVVGGYKFSGAPEIDLSPSPAKTASVPTSPSIPDDVTIPDDLAVPEFLRRKIGGPQ